MFRIRFHGRGGQGIKTASRVLGTALFGQGFEVQDAPRYGAERRGAPVFAYVRAARGPIHERGVIRQPDLVIVVDDSVTAMPSAGVLTGVHPKTIVLIRSHVPSDAWVERLGLSSPVIILPVREDQQTRADIVLGGVSCAGAAARLLGVIPRQGLDQAITDELTSLGTEAVRASREAALSSYDSMAEHAACVVEAADDSPLSYRSPSWVDLAAEQAAFALPAIARPLTSDRAQTGLWRTTRPVIDGERCGLCAWICSTYCAENAISVGADGRPRIDYTHCKGCMLCAEGCPWQAISAVPEHEVTSASNTIGENRADGR